MSGYAHIRNGSFWSILACPPWGVIKKRTAAEIEIQPNDVGGIAVHITA
jgi:hypothetical protein